MAAPDIRKKDSPSTKIFSTSCDQTSLPSLRSLWCLRWGVRDLRLRESVRDSMLALEAMLGRVKSEEDMYWLNPYRNITCPGQ